MSLILIAALAALGEPAEEPRSSNEVHWPAAVVCSSVKDLEALNIMPIPENVTNVPGLVAAGKKMGYDCKIIVNATVHNIERVADEPPITQRSGKPGYVYRCMITEDGFPTIYYVIGDK